MAKKSYFKEDLPSKIKDTFNIDKMDNKWALKRITIRYNGLFDFDSMYSGLTDWAKNYEYRWHEKSYKHKVPSPKGAEQEYSWLLEKEVNDFVKYTVMVDAKAENLNEVKIDLGDGNIKTLFNAKIEIIINGTIEFDWQSKFKGGRWAELLGPLYMKLMNKEFEIIYGDQLYYRVWNLHAMFKQFLDMSSKHHAYKGMAGDE